jgi:NAD-dependent SIR2 family protein deacetylase
MTPAAQLAAWLSGRHVAVLTGAGVSTDSGIPDYRGAGRPARRAPVQHAEFVRHATTRRRYWARSMVGWPRFRDFRPNPTHAALRRLEVAGATTGLITQNVDRLHTKAGQERVVELHGALAEVVCLGCGAREDRDALQERLVAANPGFDAGAVQLAPDGDADYEPAETFAVPACVACGGVLMPDVVFFGGSVPRERVAESYAMVDGADGLLVVGTSLAVFSGFRFARRAAERGIPIAIVNRGETRADGMAAVRIDAAVGEVLPEVC